MTKIIEFDDIRVGDKIRASRKETHVRVTGSVSVYDSAHEITVASIDHGSRRVRDGAELSIPQGSGDMEFKFELLERKVVEPTGIGAIVRFTNEVGIGRVYVRNDTASYETLRWYSANHGFESWSRITARAALGTLEVVSEGVEL